MSTALKTVKFFWAQAWKYPKHVIGLLIAMPITILLQFIPTLIAANVLERLSTGNFDKDHIFSSFGTEVLLYAVLVIFTAIVMWRINIILIWSLEALVTRNISRLVFDHLMSMSANFHANHFGGSLVSQTSKLAGSYVRVADATVFISLQLVLTIFFTVVLLWSRTPLFVIALLVFSILFLVITVALTKKVRDLGAKEAEAQNKQTGFLADAISNIMAVKSFATGQSEVKRFYKATEKTRKSTMSMMRSQVKRDALFSMITSAITAASLVIAVLSVSMFNADVATVFLVLSYTGTVVMGLWNFNHNGMRNYNRAFGDSEAMIKILDMKPEVKDTENPLPLKVTNGGIDINNVVFSHDGSGKLFNGLNLQIKPGEKIGLVGHSGSGKTSLTRILLRFSDVDKGEILIDGQNIANVAQDDLRAQIAYVPQEPLLFHRSIRENIAYGKPDATDAEIKEAAKKAHAHEFIKDLKDKYDTLVGERGVKLSGGQRQRIAIARAMLKDAPILVLDEATSALDSESEVLIQDALWKLMSDRTAIVIAHRLSTVQKMDRIIVLEAGKIIEQGDHKKLIQQKGTYAHLWSHQSGGFIEE
jgi:ATP-binding cassette subfamily B protein